MNGSNPYPVMEHYIQKYGPIFRLKLGSWNAVVISDYHQIKKAFNTAEFASRPEMFIFGLFDYHGVVSSSGNLWAEQRRFALRQLRDLGMGKNSIESHIVREIEAVTNGFKKAATDKEALDLNLTLNIAIINIVWAIVAGE